MKILTLFIGILSIGMCYSQHDYEGLRLCTPDFEFEVGSKEMLYGDRVVLRKQPSKDAAAMDTLAIGTELKILKRTDETVDVNGRESNWYKVKCKAGTGYVAGGFISLDSKEMNGGTYLVTVAGNSEEYKVRVRYLKDGEFYGKEHYLPTSTFYLTAFNNRGLEGIESMSVINLFAEACAVDGGQIYLFNDGEKLIDAIHCRSISDAGVFWFNEELKFPDEIGWGTQIVYKRESGEPMDEEMNWTRSVVHTVVLEWKEGKLEPDVNEMEFEEY